MSYPVATDEKSISFLREILGRNRCEIGLHCHLWNTPPFEEEIIIRNSMLCNLPYEILQNKIKTLHEAIIEAFKLVPTCFRAGRWGFGAMVALCIHKFGYRVDNSVIRFFQGTDYEGPDFREANNSPYRFEQNDVLFAT